MKNKVDELELELETVVRSYMETMNPEVIQAYGNYTAAVAGFWCLIFLGMIYVCYANCRTLFAKHRDLPLEEVQLRIIIVVISCIMGMLGLWANSCSFFKGLYAPTTLLVEFLKNN